MTKVTLGLVQMSMQEDKEANLKKAVCMISEAAQKGAHVVALPELFTSPYFPREENGTCKYAEKIPGPTSEALSEAAAGNGVVVVGGSIFEKAGKKKYNTTMVFDQKGALLGTYRKMHIPHDPNFYEQCYFEPGDLGYKVFTIKDTIRKTTNARRKTHDAKLGTLICYDQWYPEAARINALMGADIVLYPTAIGTVKGVEQSEGNWQRAWETVQRGHAIANGMIVAAVNRVGTEKNMTFWGGSFVCDAFGKILARGGLKEEVVLATVDLEHGKQVREGWRFFHNRRPETYKKLVERRE